MTKIEIIEFPEQIGHTKYLDDLLIELRDYEEKVEPYFNQLNIKVVIELPPHRKEEDRKYLTETDGIYELIIPFQRHWASKGKFTPLPTPAEVFRAVKRSIDRELKNFSNSSD